MKKHIVLLFMALVLVGQALAISNTNTYWIRDADYGGADRNGLYNVSVSYCDAVSGGNKLYNFTIPDVNFTDSEAWVDVNITSPMNFNQDLWLEVNVNGTTYTRRKVSSNLNTYEANNSQKLGNKLYSEYVYNNSGIWNININTSSMCINDQCISSWDAVNGSAVDTDTHVAGDGDYLYNTTVMKLNETRLNNTIIVITDARDSDTTYTATDTYIIINGSNVISLNTTKAEEVYITETQLDSFAELQSQIADATILQGDTLTSGKWCIYDGTNIDCNVEPVVDTDTDTLWVISNDYLYNNSGTLTLNETRLNATISALDTDTQLSGADVVAFVGNFSDWDKDYNDLINKPSMTDTNESTRVQNIVDTSCSSGNYIYNFSQDGTPLCSAPAGSGDITDINTDGQYLDGGADTGDVSLTVNEANLNATIIAITDERDSDTTYTADELYIYLDGTEFNWNTTKADVIYLTEDELNSFAELQTQIADATILQGDTLTSGKWCIYDGTNIDCNVEPVVDTDTHVAGDGIYLYNDSTTMTFNETKLNATIDDRDDVGAEENTNVEFLNITMNGMPIVKLSQHANIDGEVFGILMSNPPNGDLPHFVVQSGGSSQASYIVRSFMVVNEYAPILNSTNRTDCVAWANYFGEDLKIDCNTTTTGADLFVGDDMQVNGDVWIQDENDEWHSMNRDLDIQDEFFDGTILADVNITWNDTTLMIDSNEPDAKIEINLDDVAQLISGSEITLVNGTNTTPKDNYIYYKNDGGTYTLTNTETPADSLSITHAGIWRGVIGDVGNFYLAVKTESTNKDFMTNIFHLAMNGFEKYQSGFEVGSSSTDINYTAGVYWTGYDEFESNNALSVASDGIYWVKSDGTFEQCADLSCIDQYNDGGTIGANKYFLAVIGIVPDSTNTSRIVVIPQNEPDAEHTNSGDAETDGAKYITFTSNNGMVSKNILRLSKVILKLGDSSLYAFTNGDYHQDIVGLSVAGTSAGSTNDHGTLNGLGDDDHPQYVLDSDWTDIDNYPDGCGAGDFVSAIGDTLTCGTPSYIADTDTLWLISYDYLYNNSGTLTLNETRLNATISALDTDTTYSALSEFSNDVGYITNATRNKTAEDLSCADCIGGTEIDESTFGDVPTATALASNGANCGAGEYPLGVDSSGAVESCTDATTEINSLISTHASDNDAHHPLVSLTGQNYLTISTQTITVGEIEPDDLASSDFGDFTCDGDTCSLDASYESSTSNDFDPDRLLGDSTDNNLIDDGLISFTIEDAIADGSCTDCITDAMVSNTLTCSALTDDDTYALTGSAETFDENVAFAKNITVEECVVFGNGATWCGIS